MTLEAERLDAALTVLVRRLLDERPAPDHWDGRLASSALSTATAVLALDTAARRGGLSGDHVTPFVKAGSAWLIQHQNANGGWGDTIRSESNISTTAIVWASLSKSAGDDASVTRAIERSGAWL